MSGFEMAEPTTDEAELSAVEETAPKPNESDSAAFFRVVKKLGREAALGKESLPALVATIAEAVSNGALSPTDKFPDKEGNPNKISAAQHVFNTYADGAQAKALHERSELSIRVQTSKIKKIIDASAKAEPQNFRGALSRAFDMRKGIDAKKIKPAFDAYVDMARRIIGQDEDLSDADIEEANLKPVKTKDASVLDELKKAYQVFRKLLNSENPDRPRVYQTDARFDTLDTMRAELLDMIRQEDGNYDVPKPPKTGETTGEANGEEQTEESESQEGTEPAAQEAAPEATNPEGTPESTPVTPETQAAA